MEWVMCQFAAAVLCQKRTENRIYGITAPFLKCYHKHLCR